MNEMVRPGSFDRTPASVPIVYLYGQELPNTSANSGAVLDLCKALDAKGHPVTIFYRCGEECEEYEEAIRRLYDVPASVALRPLKTVSGPGQQPYWVWQIRQAASQSILVSRLGPCAVMAAALRISTIFEMHQLPSTIRNWRFWKRLLAMVEARHLSIAALTQTLDDQLDGDLRERSGCSTVIPSAATDFADPFQPPPAFDVGYVGSFIPGKGVEKVLEIARELQEASFVIYGDPTRNPHIASAFEELPNVTLAGFVPRVDIGGALRSFRIGLAPYASRGFGGGATPFVESSSMSSLKLIEYMSAGCVIVASRIPAVEVAARDGVEAILVDENDTRAWIDAVRRVVREPALADALRRNARQRFLEQYSFQERASRFSEMAMRLALSRSVKAASP